MSISPHDDGLVDRWLRFAPEIDRQYEAENRVPRSRHLRETLYVGLFLYNLHNVTNIFLMPDILWLAVTLRLFVVTPAVLITLSFCERMPATLREWIALGIVSGAFATEALFLWTTRSPLGNYAFSEFGLTLVFGNMLMALRFRHAVVFTALAFPLGCLAVWQRPLVDEALRFAFMVQLAMACIISLYASYKTESRRCRDYVVAHLAVLRAERSEHASKHFLDQSRTDPLTGLPNRRLLDERLAEWFADTLPVAVMMVDVDHFKLFNDLLGHMAGDACLKQVGAVLAAMQTPDILCARFGGEEFTVVVRGHDTMGVARLAQALVRAVEALGIPHPGRSDGNHVVTASIGLAARPAGGPERPHDIIAAADRALYRAKRMGRNSFAFDGANRAAETSAA